MTIEVPNIRPMEPRDIGALTALYNHFVETSVATFHLEPLTREKGRRWFGNFDDDNPLIVYTAGPDILGFAYYGPWRVKPGYDATRESTVYVADEAQGRGVGSALYAALLDHARSRGIHVMLAVIAGDNPASEALHRRFGFRQVGVLHEVGRKFGRWVDTRLYEKKL